MRKRVVYLHPQGENLRLNQLARLNTIGRRHSLARHQYCPHKEKTFRLRGFSTEGTSRRESLAFEHLKHSRESSGKGFHVSKNLSLFRVFHHSDSPYLAFFARLCCHIVRSFSASDNCLKPLYEVHLMCFSHLQDITGPSISLAPRPGSASRSVGRTS
jgi:hypothetical protein